MTLASKTGQVTYLQKGDRGMMPYPAGVYSSTVTYVATTNTAPYVLLSVTYYVMNKVGSWLGTSTGKTPAQDYADNGKNATWIPFESYKAIYVELLMANFGKIASAVFSGEFMFSQQGKNAAGAATNDYSKFGTSDFTPNLMLDFLRGIASFKKMQAEGDITATLLYLGISNNSWSELENGAVRIGSNIGKLPALSPGTCRSIKWIIPMYTRVHLPATLTTENAKVKIAPNGAVMDSVLSYDLGDVGGCTYDLYGFREYNNNTTYWCLYGIG